LYYPRRLRRQPAAHFGDMSLQAECDSMQHCLRMQSVKKSARKLIKQLRVYKQHRNEDIAWSVFQKRLSRHCVSCQEMLSTVCFLPGGAVDTLCPAGTSCRHFVSCQEKLSALCFLPGEVADTLFPARGSCLSLFPARRSCRHFASCREKLSTLCFLAGEAVVTLFPARRSCRHLVSCQ
jgi:hypothetical protein